MGRKIIAALQLSVDGFIEGPNGEMDWAMMEDDPWRWKGAVQGCEGTTYAETRRGKAVEIWQGRSDLQRTTLNIQVQCIKPMNRFCNLCLMCSGTPP